MTKQIIKVMITNTAISVIKKLLKMPTTQELNKLYQEYKTISSYEPQKRGYGLEVVLEKLFGLYSWDVERNIVKKGAQVDLWVKSNEGGRYLVEAKWWNVPIAEPEIRNFLGILEETPPEVKGAYFSMSGYRESALDRTQRLPKMTTLLLFNQYELEQILQNNMDFNYIFDKKLDAASKMEEPFLATQENFDVTKMGVFLRKLGREHDIGNEQSRYWKMEDLYVPPREYLEIREKLENNGIVFIIGDPCIGKTYTAVHLMFQSFKEQSLDPSWIFGKSDDRSERDVMRNVSKMIKQMGASYFLDIYAEYIKPNSITYIEDPFGKTNLEEAELIKSQRIFDMKELIELVKNRAQGQKESRVIVTSRRGIFERALSDDPSIREYVVELRENVDMASYDDETKAKLFGTYINAFNPAWSQDENKKAKIIEAATPKLTTPMGIWRFVEKSMDLEEIENPEAFAKRRNNILKDYVREMELMDKDEQLYLILAGMELGSENIARAYNELVGMLGLEKSKSIEECVKINSGKVDLKAWDNFTHPIYGEALNKFIEGEGSDILAKACWELKDSENFVLRSTIGRAVADNYQNLPDWKDSALRMLAGENLVSYAVLRNYQKMPQLARDIVRELANDAGVFVRTGLAYAIGEYYQETPELGDEVLKKLADDSSVWVKSAVAKAIIQNYPAMPKWKDEVIRELTRRIAGDSDAGIRKSVANAMKDYEVPPNLKEDLERILKENEAL
ncbi:restriction endonuclease [Nanoarchaeota archaeon]